MPGEVPVRRSGFSTRSTEEAHETLSKLYVRFTPRFLERPARTCAFEVRTAETDGLALDHLRYSVGMDLLADPVDYLHVTLASGGRLAIGDATEQVRLLPGDAALAPIGVPIRARWTTLDARVVRMPMPLLAGVAAARWGVDAGRFRFEGLSPITPALGRYWRDTVVYLHHLLHAPAPELPTPLMHAALIESVAAAALVTFPNTVTSAAYRSGPGHAAPSAVRRAIAFIEAHASEPITLSEIARASGAGPRGLQAAFRRHLETSPMGYLRRVRLERAHRELLAAGPSSGVTVASTARRWGFAHLSRFAAAYRAAYGVSPSDTLRGS